MIARPRRKPATLFLDISEQVSTKGNEEGLLGIAFHPKYKENGYFYLHYSSIPQNKTGILSRWSVSKEDPGKADPDSSKKILLTQAQPWRNHNGGMLEFGPDGFLYLSFGDGGALAAIPRTAGKTSPLGWAPSYASTWTRKATGAPTASRRTTPLPSPKMDEKPEIFAFGLRNVWRFSFDRETGELWAGDVGQNKWEEIDIVVNGGNYGWKTYEGFDRFSQGYRVGPGQAHRADRGLWAQGRAVDHWGLCLSGQEVSEPNWLVFLRRLSSPGTFGASPKKKMGVGTPLSRSKNSNAVIASFAEDAEGELYVLDYAGGIYRIVPREE